MRIVYKDIGKEFSQIMQQCMQRVTEVSCIQLTKEEMKTLIAHPDAPRLLSDYFGPRNAKIAAMEARIAKIRKGIPKTDGQERQALFDEMSNCEHIINSLQKEIPSSVTQSGIQVRVSLKG